MSEEVSVLLERAVFAHRTSNLQSAEELYRRALAADQGSGQANLMLGILLAQTNRPEESALLLEATLRIDPTSFRALSWLTRMLCLLGRNGEAVSAANRALVQEPDDLPTLLHLAAAHFALEQFQEASGGFQRVLKLDAKNLSAYHGLAASLLRVGQFSQARNVLNEATRVSQDPVTLLKLGEASLAAGLPNEALHVADLLLQSDPRNAEALLLRLNTLTVLADGPAEDETLAVGLNRFPESAQIHALNGRRLQRLGLFMDAEEAFWRSIELNPNQAASYYGVTQGRRIVKNDERLVDAMESLLAKGALNLDDKTHLHYALGKAYEDLGEYGRAMAHFDQGNPLFRGLRSSGSSFDREAVARRVDDVERIFAQELLGRTAEPIEGAVQPIVISGFVRSGTTLMEQILSCHPDIGAAGEQAFWTKAEGDCVDYEGNRLNMVAINTAGGQYVQMLERVAPDHRFVTEKSLPNRRIYGLIHLALPACKMLHMDRSPIDVAISTYTTLFREAAPFMGDKSDIVFALKMHERLTRHWLRVLPKQIFRVVSYEELVTDTAPAAKEVVDFLGLPWSESCLSPEHNRRTVLTPSLWQVRQPVYMSSVERWRRYEPWLGAFVELLD